MPDVESVDWNGLLQDAQNGSDRVRNQLFSLLYVRLRPVVQSRLRGWPASEQDDLLQNTLVVVAEKLDQIEANPHHYALRVMRNKVGDLFRTVTTNRLQPLITDDDELSPSDTIAAEVEDPHEAIDASRLNERIEFAVKKLSRICQLLFMAALQGKSINEIWEDFSVTESGLKRSTFDKRFFDCRQRLRRELKGYA